MKNTKYQEYFLGLQHVCAMFGSTVLVPFLTGLDVAIALLCAGLGTLAFHIITQYKVPVFLGSSFAFIPVIILVLQQYGIAYLKLGIISAGIMYFIFSIIIKKYGVEKIKTFLPAIVIGPVIISIGLKLVPVALSMSGYNNSEINYFSMSLALFTLIVVLFISFLKKGTIKLFPILISIVAGYILSIFLGIVDFSSVKYAPIFGFSSHNINTFLTIPKFDFNVILLVAPLSFVVLMEHIGDMEANGAVVNKNFVKDPGLNRTVLGDGVATVIAGFLGGPANTTYGENTGVLAATKNYNPKILRIAAVFAIILAFFGKITAIIQSIPVPIMGGISILLFGLIASIGIKTLVQAKLDYNNYKNLVIPAIIIIIGVFIDKIKITDNFILSGLFLATLVGIILNKVLPEN